jgi:hypothetical protein
MTLLIYICFNYCNYVIAIYLAAYVLLACDGDWPSCKVRDIVGDCGFFVLLSCCNLSVEVLLFGFFVYIIVGCCFSCVC